MAGACGASSGGLRSAAGGAKPLALVAEGLGGLGGHRRGLDLLGHGGRPGHQGLPGGPAPLRGVPRKKQKMYLE